MWKDPWKNSVHVLVLEQGPCGLEKRSISEAESDSDDESYETAGLCLAVRPVVQQKVKLSSLWPMGIILKGPSM